MKLNRKTYSPASISGADKIWINGNLIGETNSETDVNAVAIVSRTYNIKPEFLKDNNELLLCIDYETDASLGMNGSTGDIIFPFTINSYKAKSDSTQNSSKSSINEDLYLHVLERADDPYWHHGF